MTNPYRSQPDRAYWKRTVGAVHFADLHDLWQPVRLTRQDRIATAGSCFAQHIGRNLALRGAHYLDMEPAPAVFGSENEARRWGFGVFSCRYGNIYTARQLLQLFHEAHGTRTPAERVWQRGDRFFDALRPGIDPVGQASAADVLALRERHLGAVRRMFATVDLFVFTLGLTEGWASRDDGTIYPLAPGVVAGDYDPARHVFRNLRYGQILADMREFWQALKAVNPAARMLLTVSPVPLAATAGPEHVLVASTYSKSVLRAVAGDLAADEADIGYFPSYEIISTHPGRGAFFEPDQRNVNPTGVDLVMRHFFSGTLAREFGNPVDQAEESDLICDESRLEG